MKPVHGFDGLYAVGQDGVIVSLPKTVQQPNHPFQKTRRTKIRVVRPYPNGNGYLWVYLTDGDGRREKRFIHRLVAEAWIPRLDHQVQVNHKDGDKQNNAAINLEWCTCAENIRHAYATGLRRRPNQRG